MKHAFTFLSIVLLTIPNLRSADPAGYERVLVPVMLRSPIPGIAGSLWVTELSVRNESSRPAEIFQHECEYTCECVTIACRPEDPTPPETSFVFRPVRDTRTLNNPGVFMYVGRSAAAGVALQLRVRDLSRNALSLGTELPLVRESEMNTDEVHLLNIPTDGRFRQHLRIYAITNEGDKPAVAVRIADDSGAVLAQRTITLAGVSVPDFAPAGHPTGVPSYGEIAYVTTAIAQPVTASSFNISIEPITPGLRYWAFVSVTNNDTQEVTTVTPQ
jgi:hypothetical protein